MFKAITQSKTAQIIIGTTVGCFIIFTAFTIYNVREMAIDAEVRRLNAVADAHLSEIQRLTNSYIERAKLVASRTRLRQLFSEESERATPANKASMLQIMRDAKASDAAIISISMIDPSGGIVVSTEPELSDRQISGALKERGIEPVTETVQPVIDGEEISFITIVPVQWDDRDIGLMRVDFVAHGIRSGLRDAYFGKTGEIVLGVRDVEGSARFVSSARKRTEAVATKIADAGDQSVPMIRALGGENTVLIDGAVDYHRTPVLAVTRYIPNLDWGLVAKIDKEEVITLLSANQFALAAFGGFLIIVCLATGAAVSRRLQTELTFRNQAEARFSQMFASAPTAMLIVDAHQNITIANNKAGQLLGYDDSSLTGLALMSILPEFEQERIRFDTNAVPDAAKQDAYAVHADGKQIPVEVDLTHLDSQEGSALIVALIDISERYASQKALEERAEKLAQSNGELDEFAYVASHDLRAPLRGIDQLAEFIEDDVGDAMPEESRKDLTLLRNRIKRMDDLLNSLLDYSRVGRDASEPALIDTGALIEEVSDFCIPNKRFQVAVSEGLPSIFAPQTALEIIFRNLLTNAVKHHDQDQGTIWIDHHTTDNELIVTVTDDGPGIPDEFRDKVFKLFQTLKPRDQVEGSGMGLSLVKKTVESLGGTIELTPSEGRKAIFTLRWPIGAIKVRDAA